MRSYPVFKTSNHLACKPKGTLGKVVEVTRREKGSKQRLLRERKFVLLIKGKKSRRIGRFY